MKILRFILMAIVAGSLGLAVATPAQAGHYTCTPTPTLGCVKVILPPGITADFYGPGLPDPVLMAGQHNVFEVGGTSNLSLSFTVKNFQSSEAGFGTLFTYPDTSVKVSWKVNQTVTTHVTLKKVYTRGTLELTCDIKNHSGENVSCGVSIDGAVPAANPTLTPSQVASYVLDPGTHTVTVTLAGANANLWAPATFSKTVTIKASATATKLKAEFKKSGHMIVNMNQPGALGDFYVDGVLIATQVASIDQWVTSNLHKIEIKNITDSSITATDPYHWQDANATVTIPSGKDKTVTINLKKEGNWAQPFEYRLPKGYFTEGAHTYILSYTCPDSGLTTTNGFNVSASAGLLARDLFMRFSGIERDRLDRGNTVDPINPNQALLALITLQQRVKADAEAKANVCSASISFDGGSPIALTPGKVYQTKP